MNGQALVLATPSGKPFNIYLALPECGSGPGLLLLDQGNVREQAFRATAELYAEEGYVVLAAGFDIAADSDRWLDASTLEPIPEALLYLRRNRACTGKIGVLGFGRAGTVACLAAARLEVDAAVAYYPTEPELAAEASALKCPLAIHLAAKNLSATSAALERIRAAFAPGDLVEFYVYPDAGSSFDRQQTKSYHLPSASLAYSRTIGLLRRTIGPRYDLEELWEKHTQNEFVTRDTDATMRTMVAEPYVNHVPTMTGGYGRKELHRFYGNHFIPRLPRDTRIVSVSRTVGADRLVDELLFCFTHDVEIDFLLPGIKPTGKYVEIPMVAIVQFRGDKLYNEHIYWDQASALVQIGVLGPTGLPVAGIETAEKIRDESRPANTLMTKWKDSEGR